MFERGLPDFVPAPPGHYPAPRGRRPLVGLRPAGRGDRARVEEICGEVLRGGDHLPHHFDDWIDADDGTFMVAEVDGRVAALHRAAPAGGGVLWYEGLRVAPEFLGRGLGRTMVEMAATAAARRGYRDMRLHAGPECAGFFERAGFTPLVRVARWDAETSRKGSLPAVLAPEHTSVALGWLRQDRAFNRYPGLMPVFGGSADSDWRTLNRLARDGRLCFSGEVPSFAALRPTPARGPLRVTFLAGGGESMFQLLRGIRHRARVAGARRVRVIAPVDHPCAPEMLAAGFSVRDEFRLTVYSRRLGETALIN